MDLFCPGVPNIMASECLYIIRILPDTPVQARC